MTFNLRLAYFIKAVAEKFIKNKGLINKQQEDSRWLALFESNNHFTGKLNEKIHFKFYKDSILSRLIYTGFEKDEVTFLRRFLRPGDTFFDIGANIGLFSLHAAEVITESGTVHAFEPTPTTFTRLLENIELNGFEKIITPNNLGLSSTSGKLMLNTSSDGHDAWNTFSTKSELAFDCQVEMPVKTLDEYMLENNLSAKDIRLIKMDVEGWEMEVVKGAKKLLESDDSPVFMVEFTETNLFAAGTNCYELYDTFSFYGFKWYSYNSEHNLLVEDPKKIHYPYNNLIAIKKIDFACDRIGMPINRND